MNTHDADVSRQGDEDSPVLKGDRGKIKGKKNKMLILLGIPVLLVAFLVFSFFYTKLNPGAKKSKPTANKEETVVSSAPGSQAEKKSPTVEMKMPPPETPLPEAKPIEIVPNITGRDYSKMERAAPKKEVDPWETARTPHFTQGEKKEKGGATLVPLSSSDSDLVGMPSEDNMPTEKLGGQKFADKLKPALADGVKAKKIANPSLTITEGTMAACILQTAVKTDVAGKITCKVEKDVSSTDGQVVLLSRDSLCIGEYHNLLEMGEEAIFVLWSRCIDKQTFVSIDLNSPGTDELGRAGMTGRINTKFWQRFGAAIMVSLIGDVPSLIGRTSGTTTVNAFSNTAGAASDSVKSVLEIFRNVRPTLEKDQGGRVNILFARDADFSGVYSLRKKVVPE